jgi:hypothetical protein
MKTLLSGVFLSLMMVISGSVYAVINPDRFLGPRDIRGIKLTISNHIIQDETLIRYGNWYDAKVWEGNFTAKLGNNLPVDSLDAIAQGHAFAYQIAEQRGRIYGICEEKRIKSIADYFAVRDAKALSGYPNQWQQTPSDVSKASRYRDRMMTGFSEQTIGLKTPDWVTSPIENWQQDKSHQLAISDLEKQLSTLQNDWNNNNLTPINSPNSDERINNPAPQ